MYYEEKLIDGILHFRSTPDAEFEPYTLTELSRRYVELNKRFNELYAYNLEGEK